MLDLAAIADLDAEMNRPDTDGNGTAAAAGACRSHVTIEQKAKVRNDFDRGSMSLHKYGSNERTSARTIQINTRLTEIVGEVAKMVRITCQDRLRSKSYLLGVIYLNPPHRERVLYRCSAQREQDVSRGVLEREGSSG